MEYHLSKSLSFLPLSLNLSLSLSLFLFLAEVFVLLVLLTSWLDPSQLCKLPHQQYDAVEFFAGAGQVSAAFRMSGQTCASLDYDYDRVVKKPGAMNIQTDSGLVLLVSHNLSFPVPCYL